MDGIHVEEPMLRQMLHAGGAFEKDPRNIRITATSDAATYPGNQDYSFNFGPGGAQVFYTGKDNRCADANGTL
jgi:hypothetical protein